MAGGSTCLVFQASVSFRRSRWRIGLFLGIPRCVPQCHALTKLELDELRIQHNSTMQSGAFRRHFRRFCPRDCRHPSRQKLPIHPRWLKEN